MHWEQLLMLALNRLVGEGLCRTWYSQITKKRSRVWQPTAALDTVTLKW